MKRFNSVSFLMFDVRTSFYIGFFFYFLCSDATHRKRRSVVFMSLATMNHAGVWPGGSQVHAITARQSNKESGWLKGPFPAAVCALQRGPLYWYRLFTLLPVCKMKLFVRYNRLFFFFFNHQSGKTVRHMPNTLLNTLPAAAAAWKITDVMSRSSRFLLTLMNDASPDRRRKTVRRA